MGNFKKVLEKLNESSEPGITDFSKKFIESFTSLIKDEKYRNEYIDEIKKMSNKDELLKFLKFYKKTMLNKLFQRQFNLIL